MRKTLLVVPAIALFALASCKKEERAPEPLAAAEPPPAPVPPPAPPALEAAAPAVPPPAATSVASTPPAAPIAAPRPKTGAPATSGSVPAASASAAPDAGKPSVSSQAQAILRCCSALSAIHKKGGPNANRYESASTICRRIAADVQKGTTKADAARTTIRAQLQGIAVPAACN